RRVESRFPVGADHRPSDQGPRLEVAPCGRVVGGAPLRKQELSPLGATPPEEEGSVDRLLDELVALERSTLDRWVMKPPFTDPRYDLIDPKVERNGDVARLTFNLVNY